MQIETFDKLVQEIETTVAPESIGYSVDIFLAGGIRITGSWYRRSGPIVKVYNSDEDRSVFVDIAHIAAVAVEV